MSITPFEDSPCICGITQGDINGMWTVVLDDPNAVGCHWSGHLDPDPSMFNRYVFSSSDEYIGDTALHMAEMENEVLVDWSTIFAGEISQEMSYTAHPLIED